MALAALASFALGAALAFGGGLAGAFAARLAAALAAAAAAAAACAAAAGSAAAAPVVGRRGDDLGAILGPLDPCLFARGVVDVSTPETVPQ